MQEQRTNEREQRLNELRSQSTKDLSGRRDAVNEKVLTVFKEAEAEGGDLDLTKVKSVDGTPTEIAENLRAWKAETDEIGLVLDERTQFKHQKEQAEKIAQQREQAVNGSPPSTGKASESGERPRRKSIAEAAREIVSSERFAEAVKSGTLRDNALNFDLKDTIFSPSAEQAEAKTTMTTSAGFAQEVERLDKIAYTATRRPTLMQRLSVVPTDQDTIYWMEETTFTDNTAPKAEDASLPENALAFTQRSQPVELIGAYIPATEQQLSNGNQVESIIRDRLSLMWELEAENQLVTGNGTTPNLEGFLNKTGIQTQALGADSRPDAIYKAMTKLRTVQYVEPTDVIIHPNDWQPIRLLTDGNGNYIWGSPAEKGPEFIWGVPVHQTTVITENTALVSDFSPINTQVHLREGARVTIGLVNDDFIKNKMTFKVTGRLCLEISRAKALCTVTGI